MAHTKGETARDRLLRAAEELFYQDGIVATGIDRIVARAGVAKQSLYNNFASKSALIEAYIEARHAEWLAFHAARVEGLDDPQARILAVVDAYADHANFAYERGFRGCGLLNAAAELLPGDPGRAAVRRHKEEVEAILRSELAEICGEAAAARYARQFAFLIEGAMVRAGLEGSDACLREMRDMLSVMMPGQDPAGEE